MNGAESPEFVLHLELVRQFGSIGPGLLFMGFFYGMTVCSFSCFPIVGPYVFAAQGGFQRSFELVAVFMLSKMAGYVVLGAISGQLGATAPDLINGGWLLTFEGVLIAAIGAVLVLKRPGCGCVAPKRPGATQLLLHHPYLHMASLGVVTSLVPCLPLSATLLACASTKSAAQGALYASLFGLGTLASPLCYAGAATGWLSQRIVTEIPRHRTALRVLSGALLALLGARLTLSGA